MATTLDLYGRSATQDQGSPLPPGAPGAFAGNGSPVYVHAVSQAAGAGTTKDLPINIGYKCRVIDVKVICTTTVTSAVCQLFPQTGGSGTALSSQMTCAAPGVTRDALAAASTVTAMGGTIYARLSGGATLPGVEVYVFVCPEQ